MSQSTKILSKNYWQSAAKNFADLRIIAFAAMIIALRVVVKSLKIPIADGVFLTTDCYVNALGSIIYGPLVGLAVGAVSDTLGCIFFPTGLYFFPYIFVEMSSSFIFGLFFWKRPISVTNSIAAKFTVNLFCNIILNSIFYKWYCFYFFGMEKAAAYNIINLIRIGKNLVLFPFEAVLITLFLSAMLPALKSLKLLPKDQNSIVLTKRNFILIGVLTVLSVLLILFYIFFLKDFISAYNIKLL